MRLVLMAVVAAALTGCVTVQPGGENVVLTGNNDQVRGCKLIRQVAVDQIWSTGVAGREDVFKKFRNEAVQAGATHVLTLNIGEQSGGMMSNTHSSGLGELYRCPS